MVSHSEYAAVQAIRFRGHVALRHVGGMFGKERFRRPLGEPRSRPPRRHAHGSGRYVLTPSQIMYNESASLSRQSEPCKSSNSPIYVRYGGDSAPRTTRAREAEFPRPSTRKYPDRCAARLCTDHCGPVRVTVTCLPRGGVVGPVFDGRVGNGVPAVRVAVSGYYEKLELTLKLTSAARVRRPELPRLISG